MNIVDTDIFYMRIHHTDHKQSQKANLINHIRKCRYTDFKTVSTKYFYTRILFLTTRTHSEPRHILWLLGVEDKSSPATQPHVQLLPLVIIIRHVAVFCPLEYLKMQHAFPFMSHADYNFRSIKCTDTTVVCFTL